MLEQKSQVPEREYDDEGSSDYGGNSIHEHSDMVEQPEARQRFRTELPVFEFDAANNAVIQGQKSFDFPYRQSVGRWSFIKRAI